MLFGKNKTKFVRIIALGVLAEYRKMGIEAIFFAKNIQEAKRRGLTGGEASWVLENNDAMIASIDKNYEQAIAAANQLGGERYKTYRLYKMKI